MDVLSEVDIGVTSGLVSFGQVESKYLAFFSETYEEPLGVNVILKEHGELRVMEEPIIIVVTRESLQDRSIIETSGSSGAVEPELVGHR